MFCTFGMWSITAILLGCYVTASKCYDDISLASRTLGKCTIQITNAVTHCKTDSEQCIAELSKVVQYMGVANVSMSRAVAGCLAMPKITEDCKDDGKFVGQDFTIISFKGLEVIEDCAISKSNRCAGDVSSILKATDDAIAHVDKLQTDCAFAPGSKCAIELNYLSQQLSEAEEMFVKAQTDCTTIGTECIDDMLLGVSLLMDSSGDALMAIYNCTNPNAVKFDH